MRHCSILALLMLVPSTMLAVESTPDPITPAQAAMKLKEKVTVQMLVKSTGGRENCYLNSEDDFTLATNFTIFLSKNAKEKFKKAGIDNPAEHFKKKTLQVTGTVTLVEKKPRIEVTEVSQIKVVDAK